MRALFTRRQLQSAERQAAFYARYKNIGRLAYRADRGGRANARSRLTTHERIILLVGELEADVNNGGFSQYLGNKGRRRAQAALRALLNIGAKKIARWLASALQSDATAGTLEQLDRRFFDQPEDLPSLVMKHLAPITKRSLRVRVPER